MSKNLSPKMTRWLRYADSEHRALQAHREYVPQEMPKTTRDALVSRGLMTKTTLEGMGGGYTFYRISPEGQAHVALKENS